jgi:hypothetical protein
VNAIADALAANRALYMPAGYYKISSDVVTNLHAYKSQGLNIFGDGRNSTYLQFDPDKGWNITGNAGDDIVFGRISYMHVGGMHTGAFWTFGRSDYLAPINEFILDDLFISNGSAASTASALQLNGFYNGYVNAVINGGGFDIPTNIGKGFAALDLQQCAFSTFLGSYSLSANGGYLRDNFVYGNTFLNIDTEACTTCWNIAIGSAINNTWIGGQISLATNGIIASAGAGNIFLNPNIVTSSLTHNVSGTVGLWLKTPGFNNVTTPAMPGSGSTVTNNTGQTVMVLINGGTVSAIAKNGATIVSVTQGVYTIILEPGNTIAITYSSTPGWNWTRIA